MTLSRLNIWISSHNNFRMFYVKSNESASTVDDDAGAESISAWMETRPAEWKPSISLLELFAQFNLWMHAMELKMQIRIVVDVAIHVDEPSMHSSEFPISIRIDDSEI